MCNCKPVSTPLTAHFKLSAESYPQSKEDIEKIPHVPYSNAVGSLICAMVCIRPNLSHAMT